MSQLHSGDITEEGLGFMASVWSWQVQVQRTLISNQQGPPGKGPEEQVPIRPEERRQTVMEVAGHWKEPWYSRLILQAWHLPRTLTAANNRWRRSPRNCPVLKHCLLICGVGPLQRSNTGFSIISQPMKRQEEKEKRNGKVGACPSLTGSKFSEDSGLWLLIS